MSDPAEVESQSRGCMLLVLFWLVTLGVAFYAGLRFAGT